MDISAYLKLLTVFMGISFSDAASEQRPLYSQIQQRPAIYSTVQVQVGNYKMLVNGNDESFDKNLMPIRLNNSIYFPIKPIVSKLNGTIEFNNTSKNYKILLLDNLIQIQPNKNIATINEKFINIGVPPIIKNDTLYISARILNYLPKTILDYDNKQNILKITIPSTQVTNSTSESSILSNINASFFENLDSQINSQLYNLIQSALENYQDSIDVSKYSGNKEKSKQILEIFSKVTDENPTLYYVDTNNCIYYNSGKLEIKYLLSIDQINSSKLIIDNKISSILTSIIKPQMNDYEKELAIHDYIVSHTKYDQTNYKLNSLTPESHNITGVLLNNVGVCDGYAKTFNLLLNKAGIESYIITGMGYKDSGSKEPHAWNIVKINGEYYHVDITWDDPVPDKGNEVSYTYFNVSDDFIKKDHSWLSKTPTCISNKENYFNKNNFFVSNKNEFILKALSDISQKKSEGTYKILDYNKQNYNIIDIISKELDNYNPYRVRSYYISIWELDNIVKIKYTYY